MTAWRVFSAVRWAFKKQSIRKRMKMTERELKYVTIDAELEDHDRAQLTLTLLRQMRTLRDQYSNLK